MAGWLTSAIMSLQSLGFKVDTQAKADDDLIMHVELLKAYMHDTGMSISASIVVRIGYMHPGGSVLAQQLYRGDSTSVDWASADREIDRDFRLATEDFLQRLLPDLDRYCAVARQPTPTAATQK